MPLDTMPGTGEADESPANLRAPACESWQLAPRYDTQALAKGPHKNDDAMYSSMADGGMYWGRGGGGLPFCSRSGQLSTAETLATCACTKCKAEASDRTGHLCGVYDMHIATAIT